MKKNTIKVTSTILALLLSSTLNYNVLADNPDLTIRYKNVYDTNTYSYYTKNAKNMLIKWKVTGKAKNAIKLHQNEGSNNFITIDTKNKINGNAKIEVKFYKKTKNNKYVFVKKRIDNIIVKNSNTNWGLDVTTKNITPTSITYSCKQSNYKLEQPLTTTSYFTIEIFKNNKWQEIKPINNIAWTKELRIIPINEEVEWECNFEHIYGKLSNGKYRIGKQISGKNLNGDYETKMYFSEFEIINSSTNWNLDITAKNITPTSVTYSCKQSNDKLNKELTTTSYFVIEEFKNNKWQEVSTINNGLTAWTMELRIIPVNEEVEWECNFEHIYGKLPNGKYRVGKQISGETLDGDYETKMYFAEFNIN